MRVILEAIVDMCREGQLRARKSEQSEQGAKMINLSLAQNQE
jgi:hypothetical protein